MKKKKMEKKNLKNIENKFLQKEKKDSLEHVTIYIIKQENS